MMEGWNSFFQFGVPTGILMALLIGGFWSSWKVASWLSSKFLDPLGGEDGILARFFQTQSDNSKKQTELMQEQKLLTSKLTESIGTLGVAQKEHFTESSNFYHHSDIIQLDLIRMHGLLAEAFRKTTDNEEAKEILLEIDSIVQGYLKTPKQ